MNNLRFGLYAVALFALAYVGVSWAARSLPVMAMRSAPAKPDVAATRAPVVADTVEPNVRREPAIASIAPSGTPSSLPKFSPSEIPGRSPRAIDAGRNQLRLTATQAAEAYARSPCDPAFKAAFIVAVSTYLRAMSGERAEHDATTSAPIEPRLREAIQAAFEAGGVRKDEFPTGTQLRLAAFAAPRGDAEPRCAVARQVESLRR